MDIYQNPGIYSLDEIYDPDTNPNGSIVPAVNSLVVDGVNDGRTYYVKFIDPTTYKPDLEYVKASVASIEGSDINLLKSSIIDYGNQRFYAYFTTESIPTKIVLDKKLVILGVNNQYYRILRYANPGDNELSVISANYNDTGTYEGEFCPLVPTDASNYVKYCHDCFTHYELNDGELLVLEVYDHNRILSFTITLFAKNVSSFSISATPRIITGLELECSQELNNETFYAYPNQNLDTLNITPILSTNTGELIPLTIDNTKCIVYGLNDFTPAWPGQESRLICKYYLSSSEVADPGIVSNNNIIVIEKTIKVISDTTDTYSLKISMIPKYDPVTQHYVLFFYMYVVDTGEVFDVTSYVQLLTNWDGIEYNNYQQVLISLNLNDILPITDDEVYQQTNLIKLNPFSFYEKYIIRQSNEDEFGIFGVEGGDLRRPIIYYDTSNDDYMIPNGVFTNKDKFLEMFYYRARPPYNTEIYNSPIEPTHFTLRDISTGNTLLSTPLEVDNYSMSFTTTVSYSLANTNVIVEFLTYDAGTSTYKIIFGVPVDVMNQP